MDIRNPQQSPATAPELADVGEGPSHAEQAEARTDEVQLHSETQVGRARDGFGIGQGQGSRIFGQVQAAGQSDLAELKDPELQAPQRFGAINLALVAVPLGNFAEERVDAFLASIAARFPQGEQPRYTELLALREIVAAVQHAVPALPGAASAARARIDTFFRGYGLEVDRTLPCECASARLDRDWVETEFHNLGQVLTGLGRRVSPQDTMHLRERLLRVVDERDLCFAYDCLCKSVPTERREWLLEHGAFDFLAKASWQRRLARDLTGYFVELRQLLFRGADLEATLAAIDVFFERHCFDAELMGRALDYIARLGRHAGRSEILRAWLDRAHDYVAAQLAGRFSRYHEVRRLRIRLAEGVYRDSPNLYYAELAAALLSDRLVEYYTAWVNIQFYYYEVLITMLQAHDEEQERQARISRNRSAGHMVDADGFIIRTAQDIHAEFVRLRERERETKLIREIEAYIDFRARVADYLSRRASGLGDVSSALSELSAELARFVVPAVRDEAFVALYCHTTDGLGALAAGRAEARAPFPLPRPAA